MLALINSDLSVHTSLLTCTRPAKEGGVDTCSLVISGQLLYVFPVCLFAACDRGGLVFVWLPEDKGFN